MSTSKSCCHNCTKRSVELINGSYVNCHTWCPDHAEEKAENERKKAMMRNNSAYDDYIRNRNYTNSDKRVKHLKDIRGLQNFHK